MHTHKLKLALEYKQNNKEFFWNKKNSLLFYNALVILYFIVFWRFRNIYYDFATMRTIASLQLISGKKRKWISRGNEWNSMFFVYIKYRKYYISSYFADNLSGYHFFIAIRAVHNKNSFLINEYVFVFQKKINHVEI